MACEPWAIKVFWRNGGHNVCFYSTLEAAQQAEAYFKYCDNVDHYLGPEYKPHQAENRERMMIKMAVMDIEEDIKSVWEY